MHRGYRAREQEQRDGVRVTVDTGRKGLMAGLAGGGLTSNTLKFLEFGFWGLVKQSRCDFSFIIFI